MAAAHRRIDRPGHLRLDWALIPVALIAFAVIVGAAIRTGPPAAARLFGVEVGGLRALSDTETLVLFEDGGTAIAGWSAGMRHVDHPGLGPVWLADPADQPMTRVIALPEGTVRALLSFDLVAFEDVSALALSVVIDGAEVLRQRFASDGQAAPAPEILGRSDRIALRSRINNPRSLAGPPALSVQRLHVDVAAVTTAGEITLTLAPLSSDTRAGSIPPLWAVDNLVVVAERLP
ncbi:hypothetical protein [Roseicyclus marinus]|uniref:hypothetical protein n=1 Tax=Roseicyclus marinus TaxID=2161673 RepID=UPI00240F3358|nr:hypothetical protein [Roseicyclus marinus]MDG3041183.1 hypothetical protein [Roseicyclus marinus]